MAAATVQFVSTPPTFRILKKCQHSVYRVGRGKRSPYCSICFPQGPPFETRPVVLPRSCGDPLEAPEDRAHERMSGYCPACESSIYIETKNGKRECADCSTVYAGPRKRGHQ